jgi:Ca2+-binding RTX toxin-like protein
LPRSPRRSSAGPAGQTLTGSANDDLIVGGTGNDILIATGGDNILVDGAGEDILRGGPGADIFVLVSDGLRDRVEGFQPGIDRLDLSSFPGLYAVSSLSITPGRGRRADRLRRRGDRAFTADGRSLRARDLTEDDILGVTRPRSSRSAATWSGPPGTTRSSAPTWATGSAASAGTTG